MKKYIILLLILFIFSSISQAQELLPANKNVLDSIKSANKGKVILFNFWATWCKPCVEEFPDLVKLNEKYKDSTFKIVFVSLDFGKALGEKTKAFLKKHDVDYTSYFNNFAKDEDLINYMDKNWEGSIPATFIFDKAGVLKKSFIGKQKYDDFKKVVIKYLK